MRYYIYISLIAVLSVLCFNNAMGQGVSVVGNNNVNGKTLIKSDFLLSKLSNTDSGIVYIGADSIARILPLSYVKGGGGSGSVDSVTISNDSLFYWTAGTDIYVGMVSGTAIDTTGLSDRINYNLTRIDGLSDTALLHTDSLGAHTAWLSSIEGQIAAIPTANDFQTVLDNGNTSNKDFIIDRTSYTGTTRIGDGISSFNPPNPSRVSLYVSSKTKGEGATSGVGYGIQSVAEYIDSVGFLSSTTLQGITGIAVASSSTSSGGLEEHDFTFGSAGANMMGIVGGATTRDSAYTTSAAGVVGLVTAIQQSHIRFAANFLSIGHKRGTGTAIDSLAGLYIQQRGNNLGSGTLGSNYGIFIDSMAGGNTNYGIWFDNNPSNGSIATENNQDFSIKTGAGAATKIHGTLYGYDTAHLTGEVYTPNLPTGTQSNIVYIGADGRHYEGAAPAGADSSTYAPNYRVDSAKANLRTQIDGKISNTSVPGTSESKSINITGDVQAGRYRATGIGSVSYYMANSTAIRGLATTGGTTYFDASLDATTGAQFFRADSSVFNGKLVVNNNFQVGTDGKIKEYGNAKPANGQLLIGDGTDMELATITPGFGVDVTNGGGSIEIKVDTSDLETMFFKNYGNSFGDDFKLGNMTWDQWIYGDGNGDFIFNNGSGPGWMFHFVQNNQDTALTINTQNEVLVGSVANSPVDAGSYKLQVQGNVYIRDSIFIANPLKAATKDTVLAWQSGKVYAVPMPSGGGGGSTAWGGITGTLSDQTDLQSELDAKQDALGFTAVPNTRTVNGSPLSSDVTITTITGNAGTATTLQTARNIDGVSFNGSANIALPRVWQGKLAGETDTLTTGVKLTFRMPYACTITGVKAAVNTASSSGNITIDIHENGTTIMSTTKITINATETSSLAVGTTQPVLTDTSIAADALMTVEVDAAGTNAIAGEVTIYYTLQ